MYRNSKETLIPLFYISKEMKFKSIFQTSSYIIFASFFLPIHVLNMNDASLIQLLL